MNPNQMAANPRAKENSQMKAIVLTNYGSAKSTCGISRRTVRFSRRARASRGRDSASSWVRRA